MVKTLIIVRSVKYYRKLGKTQNVYFTYANCILPGQMKYFRINFELIRDPLLELIQN